MNPNQNLNQNQRTVQSDPINSGPTTSYRPNQTPGEKKVNPVGMPSASIANASTQELPSNDSINPDLTKTSNSPTTIDSSVTADSSNKPKNLSKSQSQGKTPPKDGSSEGRSRSKSRDVIKGDKPKESLLQKLNMYAIPIIAVIVLVILTILLYIPFINQILDTRQDIETIEAEIAMNQSKIDKLESIDLQELDNLLRVVSKVVRDNMDVAALASEVESAAQENNLKPGKISFQGSEGSSSLGALDEMDSVSEYARSISGPFSFYGARSDIVNFLRDLRLNSSTVLALSNVDIGKYSAQEDVEDSSDQLWSVDIDIRGYLVSPVTSTEVSRPISVDIDEDIIDEIKAIVDEEYSTSEDVDETVDSE